VIKNNHSALWTVEEEKKLLELQAAGRSKARMALALRRTTLSIKARLYILRVNARQGELPASDHPSP
jgi:hypothetical protein